MSEQGLVIETRPNGTALVEITVRSGDCGSCELCSSTTNARLIASNPVSAMKGDAVEIEPRKPGLGGSALVFLVPLLLFLLGGGVSLSLLKTSSWSSFAEPVSAGIGLVLMGGWFILLRFILPQSPGKGISRIVRVIKPAG